MSGFVYISRQAPEKWILDIRDDEPDRLRFFHRETPGDVIRHISKLPCGPDYILAGLLIHAWAIVEHE